MLLLLIATISCISLMGSPRALCQITPLPNANSMNEQEMTSNRPYCTYERLENSAPARCIKATNNCIENCLWKSIKCCNPICPSPRHCKNCCMALVTIINAPFILPFTCIKDTVCLPCDRNENPPKCYPYTKWVVKDLCYYITCGLSEND